MTIKLLTSMMMSALFLLIFLTPVSASEEEWILHFDQTDHKEIVKQLLHEDQVIGELPLSLLVSGTPPEHQLITTVERNALKQAHAEISPDLYINDQWGLSAVNQQTINDLYPQAGENLLKNNELIIDKNKTILNSGKFQAKTIEFSPDIALSRISVEIEAKTEDTYWGIEVKDEKGNLLGVNYGRFTRLDILIPNDRPINKIHITLMNKDNVPEPFNISSLKGVNNPVVAVLDSGVALHEDFCSNILYSLSNDYTKEAYSWAQDTYGHGTHVTGIIASCYNNGIGTSGVFGHAPIDVLPMKVLNERGTGTDFEISQALFDAIELNVSAVNISIAGTVKTELLKNALIKAASQEIPVIAAAGNYNSSTKDVYPASYPTVITVSGINQQMQKVNTSNFGWEVDLAAPGFEVLSTYINPPYRKMNGTSMAAPFVTGAVALIKHQYPEDSLLSIRQKLFNSTKDIMTEGYDLWSGHGVVQFEPDRWENTPPTAMEWMNYRQGQPYSSEEFHLLTDEDLTGSDLHVFVNGRESFNGKITDHYQSIKISSPVQPAFKLFTVITNGEQILEQQYLNLAPNAQASFTFSDTASNYWAYEEIMKATSIGIINGYEDRTFRPDAPISRKHAALMMNRLFEWDTLPSMESSFNDIESFDFITKHSILSANYEKVLNGYENGLFKPNQQLSRSQMALILFRALQLNESNSEIDLLFTDVSPESEIFSALSTLVSKGIVTNQKQFKPYESISRAQFSAMMTRAQRYMDNK
ncbi:S8 family peptidase [Jeotgalibacillus malaysiensis]|uniref:S8 family peptidase n=1 Tax=Jeotgalibacillus malaysiensis TaxID=1508404 RepID=UPI00384C1DEC